MPPKPITAQFDVQFVFIMCLNYYLAEEGMKKKHKQETKSKIDLFLKLYMLLFLKSHKVSMRKHNKHPQPTSILQHQYTEVKIDMIKI